MPQNPTEFELKLFFNNPLFGVFFMQTEQAVQWVKGASNTEELEYLLHHLRLYRINDTMLKQYKARLGDFLGRTPANFFEHDLDQERVLLRAIFEQGRHHAISTERNANGEEVIFEGDYQAIYNEAGAITGLMGIQQDITEREHHRQAVQVQNEQLMKIAWMQSHLMRAPLARLMSLTDLLYLQNQGDAELLEKLRTSADELDAIIHAMAAESEQLRAPFRQ
ncbi:MAG: hypothetical protein C0424_08955 [Sphingobacteriaceae bacterium]|nr:hypothetical protein [Sphingobacteriaceae bacterium]